MEQILRSAVPPPAALILTVLLAACSPPGGREARRPPVLSAVELLGTGGTEGYARALVPRELRFPADHGPHEAFRTEWWYFTGNLQAADGRRFGYQLTFFRNALAPEMPERASAWASRQVYLAHFALSDLDGGAFRARERLARAGVSLAGARAEPFAVWLEDWSVRAGEGGGWPWRLRAAAGGDSLSLELTSAKPPVAHGERGLSRKGSLPGSASYYYSLTRMPSTGTLTLGGRAFSVAGESWLDREWATNVLEPGQVGWDWFSLQLDDGRELMFFELRREGGETDPASHGTLVTPDGTGRPLALRDFRLEVSATWQSPRGAAYPAAWRLTIPSEDLELDLAAALPDQELDLSFRYWEGSITARGLSRGQPVAGHGYAELVGYGE